MIDDEIKELQSISKRVDTSFEKSESAAEIRKKAGEKDSLNEYLSERELDFEEVINCEKPVTTEEIIDSKKKRIEFSLKDYNEMVLLGCTPSVEGFVADLLSDEQTIVHCTDNNTDYSFQKSSALVEFIKSNTNKTPEIS